MAFLLAGTYLVDAAQRLILDVLAQYPEGLTNTEVGEKTGLNPIIKKQNGYITWTLLTYLVEQGMIVKEGKLYRRFHSVPTLEATLGRIAGPDPVTG